MNFENVYECVFNKSYFFNVIKAWIHNINYINLDVIRK
jgi:hypothetical protein